MNAVSGRRPGQPVQGWPLALVVSASLGLAACGAGERTEADGGDRGEAPSWTLAGPMAEVGVTEGATTDELHDVADALRLPDGRIVLLDGGSAELRIFDSEGVFLAAAGGRGEGPGEFRRPARLHLPQPDSLLVEDPVLRRTSHFDTGGRFIWAEGWVESADPFPRDIWLYGRHYIDGPRRPDLRGPVRRALDRMPRPAPGGWRRVVVDPDWRLWVLAEPHDPDGAALWTVWDLDTKPLAHIRLPAGLRPTQFGSDFIVGVARDSLDVEHVRVYAVEGAPEAARREVSDFVAPPDTMPARPEPSRETLERMRRALQGIQAAQEIYYSRAGNGYRYAGSVDRLGLDAEALTGVEVHIVEAGPRGYTVLMFDDGTGASCGLAVGVGAPVGWTPGIVLCR